MRERIGDEVKRIVLRRLDATSMKVYLFGSWARGEERVTSDIDIGVLYDHSLPTGTVEFLRLDFENSAVPYRVDVVDLTQADGAFRERVFSEAILLL